MSCGLIAFFLVLYAVWDLNYFIRCVFTLGYGFLFQKKRKVMEKTSVVGKWLMRDFLAT